MKLGTSRKKERSGAKWIVKGAILSAVICLILPTMPVDAATGASRTTAIFTGNYYTQEYQIAGTSGLKITTSSYSPDGTRFAAAYSNGEVKLWRTGSGTNQLMIDNWYPHGNGNWVDDISWSPDGTKLVTVSYIGWGIKAWYFSPASPEALPIWYYADTQYNKVAWSPRGEWVAALMPTPSAPGICGLNGWVNLFNAGGSLYNPPMGYGCSYDNHLTALAWRMNKKTIGGQDRDVIAVGSKARLLETFYADPTNPNPDQKFIHDWYMTVVAPGDSKITNLSISRGTNRIAVLMESSIWGYFSVFDENGNAYSVLTALPTPSTYARAIAYSYFLFLGDGGAVTPLAIGDKYNVDIYLDSGSLLTHWTVSGKVQAVSWMPDGSRVLSGDDGSNLPVPNPTINVYKDRTMVTLTGQKYINSRPPYIKSIRFSWNAIPGAYKYFVYRAQSPDAFNFNTPWVTTTNLYFTDANYWDQSDTWYYLVRTQMGSSSGPIGAPSNMAYKQGIYIGTNEYGSVALSYYGPAKWGGTISKAADLIADINYLYLPDIVVDEVAKWTNPGWDLYTYSGGGTNFDILPGEAYRVHVTNLGSIWYSSVGAWSPSVGVPLTYANQQTQFDAIPYNYNFMNNYFGWPTQINNVAMWRQNVGPACESVWKVEPSSGAPVQMLDTDTFTRGVGYFSKTTILGWVYQGHPNYNNWLVPIIVQPDPEIEHLDIVASHEVNLTIKIAGKPGIYVDATLIDNTTVVRSMRISRQVGSPEKSTNFTLFSKYIGRDDHYTLKLSSNQEDGGFTPLWLSLGAGGQVAERFVFLGSKPRTIDLSKEMDVAITTSKNYHFAALGPNSPDTTFWDFDDGTTGQGVYVEHTYAQSGDYSVAVTIKLDDGTVLWSGTHELQVP